MPLFTRRRLLGLAALAPLAAGCRGPFPTVFGYQLGAAALYDENVTTVYVPQFHNRAFQTTPFRGFERELTKAVVDEIGRTTTFRVSSDPETADTELLGVVVRMDKTIHNLTQQNQVREGELIVAVDLVWRDLRDGRILSSPSRQRRPAPGRPDREPPPAFDPSVPPPPPDAPPQAVSPVRIVATGRYIPELGESNASASTLVQRRLAAQVVSMMEKNW